MNEPEKPAPAGEPQFLSTIRERLANWTRAYPLGQSVRTDRKDLEKTVAHIDSLTARVRELEAERSGIKKLLDAREIYLRDADNILTRIDDFIDDYFMKPLISKAVVELQANLGNKEASLTITSSPMEILEFISEQNREVDRLTKENAELRRLLIFVARVYVPKNSEQQVQLHEAIDAALSPQTAQPQPEQHARGKE